MGEHCSLAFHVYLDASECLALCYLSPEINDLSPPRGAGRDCILGPSRGTVGGDKGFVVVVVVDSDKGKA